MLFGKAIVSNTDYQTAQSFVYTKEPLKKDELKVVFCSLIAASGEDIFIKVRQIGLGLEDIFFDQDDQLDVVGRINLCVSKVKEALTGAENLNILIGVAQENAIHLEYSGLSKAYLFRDGKVLDLTSKNGEHLISGFLQSDDRLVLLTTVTSEDETEAPLIYSHEFAKELVTSPIDSLSDCLSLNAQTTQNISPIATVLLENSPYAVSFGAPKPKTSRIKVFLPKFSLPNFGLGISFISQFFKRIFTLIMQSKKTKLISLGLLVLIIGGIVALVFLLQKDNIQNQAINNQFIAINQKFSEAESLKNSDSEKAKQKLIEAKADLDKFIAQNPENSEAKELEKQFNQKQDEILKISRITNWPIFLSLDLIKDDFSAKKLAFSVDQILLIDEAKSTLVSLSLENKNNQILAGETALGQIKAASINGDSVFSYSKQKGVVRVETFSQKAIVVAKPDSAWGTIVDVVGFGGNFYLLDQFEKQIWKYVPIEGGYSDKSEYLEGTHNDLADSVRMQIDSSVWVLTTGPQILKFTSGIQDSFNISGLDKNLKESKSFFVSSDTDNLYYLDSQNSRVVVFDKLGKYVSQMVGGKFKTADDLVVDEEGKKLCLLEGNKIYQIEIK